MSLLTALQRQLTCVTLPWSPEGPATSRRLSCRIFPNGSRVVRRSRLRTFRFQWIRLPRR